MLAHRLEHFDGGDAVEPALHVAIILQAQLDALLQPCRLDPLAREISWAGEMVTPGDAAADFRAATSAKPPQPQPISSSS